MPTESVENGSNLHQSKILLSCKLIDSAQPASFAFYVAFLCRSDQSPFLLFSPWRNSMWWHTRGKNVEGEKRFFKPFSNFPNDIHRKSPSRRIFSIFFLFLVDLLCTVLCCRPNNVWVCVRWSPQKHYSLEKEGSRKKWEERPKKNCRHITIHILHPFAEDKGKVHAHKWIFCDTKGIRHIKILCYVLIANCFHFVTYFRVCQGWAMFVRWKVRWEVEIKMLAKLSVI